MAGGGLFFDIDTRELERVGLELGATARQVQLALGRSLGRTAATLRRMSERGLRSEMDLRALKFLRLRLRTIRLRTAGADGVGLWYGMNPIPVGEFKGRPENTAAGAAFRGKEFPGAFKGRNKRGQPTVFKRVGDARFPVAEQTLDVKDRMDTFLEDQVFTEVETIFWRHFRRDLEARVKFKLGER